MILVRHHNEGNLTPYFYFALEDYLLNEVLKDDETYFFTWEIRGIVVGKNQIIEKEVNIPYVKEHRIPIFRRPTGGGCVYADHRNTMFSMITKRKNKQFSFKQYLIKIVDAFKPLGVNIEFSGRNDLLFQDKKISGNSFLQNKNGMLMHGTLLYDCDLETMVRSITPSNEKLVSKGIDSVRSRVINLKPYLNGMTQAALITHLEQFLTYETYELSKDEVKMLEERSEKYASNEWIYRIQPPFTQTLSNRFSWGKVNVNINIGDGEIKYLKLEGDFFHISDALHEFEDAFTKQSYDLKIIKNIIHKNDISKYILGATSDDFFSLFESVILAS